MYNPLLTLSLIIIIITISVVVVHQIIDFNQYHEG